MNRLRYGVGLGLVLAAAACGLGDVGDPTLPEAAVPGPASTTTQTPPVPADCVEPACQTFPLAASPHAIRLTSIQWERTVRDLLKLATLPGNSVDFPPDPVASADRFGSEAGDLIVTTQHWAAYQKAAEALGQLITDDPFALDTILPEAAKSGDQAPRIAAFVADFLPRAYRRAVTPKEIADVIASSEAASAPVTSGDPFATRVKWILVNVLQSPKFLYRISFGDGPVTDKRVHLSGYEVAAKLSYGLWGTMPDDAITALARDGKLATPAGVADAARAMLADPRAATVIAEFHDELYLVDHYPEAKNRPLDVFPRFYPEFGADAQQDVRLTVEELITKGDGGLKELDTSPVAFVNTRLAYIYGIDPNTVPELANAVGPDVFVKVQMDPAQRKGLLMHPGWLTYEASPSNPSPIHRGAYVARHVLCTPLGSPPPGAAGADPSKAPGATNRLRVEATTKGCGDGCHGGKAGVINPLGFSFEGFDSVGQIRLTDNNVPVDTKSEAEVIGKFDGAVQLFDLVSTNARAHACYAAHWSAYLNGTSLVDVTPKYLSPALEVPQGRLGARNHRRARADRRLPHGLPVTGSESPWPSVVESSWLVSVVRWSACPSSKGLVPKEARADVIVPKPYALFYRRGNGVQQAIFDRNSYPSLDGYPNSKPREPERWWPMQNASTPFPFGALPGNFGPISALNEIDAYAAKTTLIKGLRHPYGTENGHPEGAAQGLTGAGVKYVNDQPDLPGLLVARRVTRQLHRSLAHA